MPSAINIYINPATGKLHVCLKEPDVPPASLAPPVIEPAGDIPLPPQPIDLGDPMYFVVTPSVTPGAWASTPRPVSEWTMQYTNGVDVKISPGSTKARIMKEQWDWIHTHPTCKVIAWYSATVPIYPCLGCQDHAVMIYPNFATKPVSVEHIQVEMVEDHVLSEEREI